MDCRRFVYQLWCYYETDDVWKVGGFFRADWQAREHLAKLRDDVNTPSMPDWEVVVVEVTG